jgi:hypothetical protein
MQVTPEHNEKIAKITFASVYPHYIAKIEKKGRTKEELLQVIKWLTDYNESQLLEFIENKTTLREFFENATLNPNDELITRQIRYLDKLVDELAKGKSMDKILRNQSK